MPDGYSLPPVSPVGPGGTPINMPSTGGTPGASWAAAIQASGGMASPTSTPATDDPLMAPIYLGQGTRGGGVADDTPHGFGSTASSPVVHVDSTVTIDSLLAKFEDMKPQEQRRLALLLTLAGFGPSSSIEDAGSKARDMTLNDTLNAYLDLLNDAAGRYARGQKVTPESLLEQNIAYRLPRGANWDGSFDGLVDILHENDISTTGIDSPTADKPKDLSGTRTTTSSNTQISRDVMDPNDAMALTRAMLQRELGRDPTKAEFEDFISAVQAAQRAHPSKTTTKTTNEVTTNKKGRVTDSNTTTNQFTHSGISSAGIQDIALRKARANPDWAEWQAVGTYAPALFQALGATVPGV